MALCVLGGKAVATQQLAKLSRPRLARAVARERLFTVLDELRNSAAVCVVGPPGAGKTTLVASWLDARDIPGVWYQIDSGDADLATFFHYLGQAARPFTRKDQRPLPALTPEYLDALPKFARRFFRELFARLPAGAALVLDNYQEMAPQQDFHEIVATAVAEVPPEQTVIAISRASPPQLFARLLANENVVLLDWEQLKLTFDEACAIAEQRGAAGETCLRQLHRQSDGWVAGLTLLLEGQRRGRLADGVVDNGREALFNYFAAQIFGQASYPTQRFLTQTAVLSNVTASVAQTLTGNAEAAAILDDLYRRHLFTHRRPGVEPAYWYHALFREFLLAQAECLLAAEERREVRQRAARLLEEQAAYDEAFPLCIECEDWKGAVRLVLRQASTLLAQGRSQRLREWIGMLPPEQLRDDPWLRYWWGISLIPVDQRLARESLRGAWDAFSIIGDAQGQCLAAAGIIDTYYFEWADFRPLTVWANTLGQVLPAATASLDRGAQLRVYASWLLSLLYADPAHRDLGRCVEHVTSMLQEEFDADARVRTAALLLGYCGITGDIQRGRQVVRDIEPLLGHPEVSPLASVWWHVRTGYLHYLDGDYARAEALLDAAHLLAIEHGLGGLRSQTLLTYTYQLMASVPTGGIERAREYGERIDRLVKDSRPYDVYARHISRLHLALFAQDIAAMRQIGHDLLAAAEATGMTYILIEALARGSHALVGTDRHAEAVRWVARARGLIENTCFEYFECELRLVEAYSAWAQDDRKSARSQLASALSLARQREYGFFNAVRFSFIMAPLMMEALDCDIEIDFVIAAIRKYRIRPPTHSPDSWPWPVKVFTLGRFEILRDGNPVEFQRKAPKKPLLALKALLALGGRDVPLRRLADAVYPDEEGDAGQRALSVSLARLRGLLGGHDTLTVIDEKVSLNADACWVDFWAFERCVSDGNAVLSRESLDESVLRLYRGAFLETEIDQPWSVRTRERLRSKFTRHLLAVAGRLEAHGRWKEAVEHYLRGLDTDDLAEEFYQGLMRCHCALNRPADGLAVYRRMRHTLSVVLGVSPSRESEALVRALRSLGEPRTSEKGWAAL